MHQSIEIRKVKSYNMTHCQSSLHSIEIEDDISATFELIKILHQYNSQNGWMLLIAPDHVPSKSLLDSCSIDKSKLLVIRKKHLSNLDYVLNSALNNGNFSAVITWTNMLTKYQLASIAKVKSSSNTNLYCFTDQKKPNNTFHMKKNS
ncbi:SulA-like leucine-rich domain-containing protein [Pseudoalteromonas denitrificans]|uniref:Cell division inhibitor SulA n=1 Tax=Pseudoalteromonas denitrificans DSM 6059 TaxID=1123010 RepID=A0A1I1KV48_9GAMM|nr:SulA-like leucine-rich domain-containing protein [Pseudoalteromonas denitrificans]SFC64659.1 cell division inhibitor SulA [Pseudoalteromonas denitrificans DSM 6059]